MKKIISLFVIATMIFGAMSLTASANDCTSTSQFILDGTTVNKLTADINANATVQLDPGQSIIVDLNGHTWSYSDIVLKVTGGDSVAKVYDSSAAKTGKIVSSGADALDISNGTLIIENITVDGGAGGSDAVFAQGGNVTIKGCTLTAGKAGLDADNRSSSAGVPVVATISDTTFAASNDGDGRNCAIELRNFTEDEKITLTGNNVFGTTKIMLRNFTGTADAVIVAGEGATVTFSDPVAHSNPEYKAQDITYSYEAPEGGDTPADPETPDTPDTPDTPADPETPENPGTGDAFIVVALTVAAVAFAGVVVSKKIRA